MLREAPEWRSLPPAGGTTRLAARRPRPPPADRETSAGPDRPSAAELGFPVTMLALAEAGQGCCGHDEPLPVPGRPRAAPETPGPCPVSARPGPAPAR